jgi:hypothetical protein
VAVYLLLSPGAVILNLLIEGRCFARQKRDLYYYSGQQKDMHLHRSFSCRSFYVRQIIRIYPKAYNFNLLFSSHCTHHTGCAYQKIWSMLRVTKPNAYPVTVANLSKIWGEIFRFALADPRILLPSSFGHMQSCALLQIYPAYDFSFLLKYSVIVPK